MILFEFDIHSKNCKRNTLAVAADETIFDIAKAKRFISDFCYKNEIEVIPGWRDSGTVLINGAKHNYDRGGIDFTMMLGFCGANPQDYMLRAAPAPMLVAGAAALAPMPAGQAQAAAQAPVLPQLIPGDMSLAQEQAYFEQLAQRRAKR